MQEQGGPHELLTRSKQEEERTPRYFLQTPFCFAIVLTVERKESEEETVYEGEGGQMGEFKEGQSEITV